MNAIGKTCIVTFLLLCAKAAFGQVYDLNRLLEESRRNYPILKSRAAEVKSASHEVSLAASEYIPRITAQHQYTYGTSNSVTGSFYPNPAVISPSGGIHDGNSYQATWGSYTSAILEWSVFNFGRIYLNTKAAKASLNNSEAAYENEIFQHQISVADAYLLSLIAKKLASIQQINLERALQFKRIVDASVNAGMRAGVDSSLANAEYSKAKLLALESARNEKTQLLRLIELSGLQESEIEAIDSMEFFTVLPRRKDSVTAIEQNPVLKFYKTRAEISQTRSYAVKRSFLPSIVLMGAVWARGSGVLNSDASVHQDFSTGTQYQVYNYLLGISTRWTVSDFFSIHQRYKAEQYKTIRDQEIYNAQRLTVNRQIKESDIQYTFALAQAQTAPVQLLAARNAFEQANARYKNGLTDLPTLLESMVALSRAEADLAIAYSNTWRSLLAIAAANGDFPLFLNSIR